MGGKVTDLMSRLKSLKVGFSKSFGICITVLPLKSVGVTDFPLGETVRPMLSALENPSLKLFSSGRNIENGRHEGKWR